MQGVKEKLEIKQLRFIELYLASGNATQSYKQAGYKFKNDNVAATSANKMLRNPKIMTEITRRKAEQTKKLALSADWVIMKLMETYELAIKAEDFSSACSALNQLGKHFGIFETHNKQKRYTQEDVEALKNRLAANGFDLSRKNFPNPSSN